MAYRMGPLGGVLWLCICLPLCLLSLLLSLPLLLLQTLTFRLCPMGLSPWWGGYTRGWGSYPGGWGRNQGWGAAYRYPWW